MSVRKYVRLYNLWLGRDGLRRAVPPFSASNSGTDGRSIEPLEGQGEGAILRRAARLFNDRPGRLLPKQLATGEYFTSLKTCEMFRLGLSEASPQLHATRGTLGKFSAFNKLGSINPVTGKPCAC